MTSWLTFIAERTLYRLFPLKILRKSPGATDTAKRYVGSLSDLLNEEFIKCEGIDALIAKTCVMYPIFQLGWCTINGQYSQIVLLPWLRCLSECNFLSMDSDKLEIFAFAFGIESNRTICLETVILEAQINRAARKMYQTFSNYAIQ